MLAGSGRGNRPRSFMWLMLMFLLMLLLIMMTLSLQLLMLEDCHVLCCFLLLGGNCNPVFSIPFLLVFFFQPAHKIWQCGLIGSRGRCNIVLPKGLPQSPSQGTNNEIVCQESRSRKELGVAVHVHVHIRIHVHVRVRIHIHVAIDIVVGVL